MEYRRLGRSGLKISKLTLGTMNFGNPTDKAESFRIINTALDAGINILDCADVYAEGASERIIGEALAENGKRKDVLVTSKAFLPTGKGPNDAGNSKHHILAACENSLKRLKTDWIHPPWRAVEAWWIADKHHYPKFICEQPPYNLLDRRVENEIVPMCKAYDLGIISWSPLAQGVLAGRYQDAADIPPGSRGAFKSIYAERITPQGIEVAQQLAQRASQIGCTLPQLAVAWVLHQPGVTAAIIGPRTLAHLNDLLSAADLNLDDSDLDYCNRLVKPGAFVSDHFNTAGWRS
jgi:aryl-alcohol dehydrogenase-like predicted oxidoreductase